MPEGTKLNDDVKHLKIKARDLKLLLEKYAVTDTDARAVLGFMSGIFAEIEREQIVPPMRDEFQWYFASTESSLFKYSDLGEAAAQYSKALELWGRQEVQHNGARFT